MPYVWERAVQGDVVTDVDVEAVFLVGRVVPFVLTKRVRLPLFSLTFVHHGKIETVSFYN